mmetsp:Transcript_18673/g.47692  ORF Transcript_18673/g.47692 Transcript_18673/m.47692 type:complete len:334 (+) Transcript_18673:800-1801(+)
MGSLPDLPPSASAPFGPVASSRAERAPRAPFAAATCTALSSPAASPSGFAPCSSSSRTQPALSPAAATCNGVTPPTPAAKTAASGSSFCRPSSLLTHPPPFLTNPPRPPPASSPLLLLPRANSAVASAASLTSASFPGLGSGAHCPATRSAACFPASSAARQSSSPRSHARCAALAPVDVSAPASAPPSISARTHAADAESRTARCSAHAPVESTASTSAPAASSPATTIACPFAAARCSAVRSALCPSADAFTAKKARPSTVSAPENGTGTAMRALSSAPAFVRTAAICASPRAAARMSASAPYDETPSSSSTSSEIVDASSAPQSATPTST